MEPIKTIDRLIYNLNMGPGYEGYVELMKAIDLLPREVENICYLNDEKYQRIQFYDTPELEGLVSCWRPGQFGPIHNCKSNIGWIKVLKGEITIKYFRNDNHGMKSFTSMVLKKGEMTMVNDSIGFHQFSNHSKSDAMVIHLNADRINKWDVYNENTGITKEVIVNWDHKVNDI